MRKSIPTIFSNQQVLYLAIMCSLFFVFRGLRFVLRVTNHKSKIISRESRSYIELSKPDEFPITLGLNNDDALKYIALPYKLEKLRSGDKLLFSDAGAISISRISGRKSLALNIPIGINSASIDDLDALPGIGPKLAGSIVEYRKLNGPFKTIGELCNIGGIGEKKFESIKRLLVWISVLLESQSRSQMGSCVPRDIHFFPRLPPLSPHSGLSRLCKVCIHKACLQTVFPPEP